jgi:hypothetical protein
MTQNKLLKQLLEFLIHNTAWNSHFQFQEYSAAMATGNTPRERLLLQLYAIANSQSQPKLDPLAKFWKSFHHAYKEDIPSIHGLVDFLTRNGVKDPLSSTTTTIEKLYLGLKTQDGWGEKTAALFVKALVSIHSSDENALHFLDTPSIEYVRSLKEEKIYLPVDAVIKHIFKSMNILAGDSFIAINKCIFKFFDSEEFASLNLTRIQAMVLFDDLWFWGFISQNSEENERKNAWNENKYWGLKYAPKNDASIAEIRRLAETFIRIITPQVI